MHLNFYCFIGGLLLYYTSIDVVSTSDFLYDQNIRIYLDTDSIEFAEEVFDTIVRVVYPKITDKELSDAHNKLRQDRSDSINDIVFYYIQSRNELFMKNISFTE